jgi:EAL domain-containing protein (putative c-di-GMP-specific phosphodiesterase class I)
MKKIGINLVQGFLFSKPMPADQVNGYIEKFSAKYQ